MNSRIQTLTIKDISTIQKKVNQEIITNIKYLNSFGAKLNESDLDIPYIDNYILSNRNINLVSLYYNTVRPKLVKFYNILNDLSSFTSYLQELDIMYKDLEIKEEYMNTMLNDIFSSIVYNNESDLEDNNLPTHIVIQIN